MSLTDTLASLNTLGLEEEIATGIIERIAQALPELTDHSPGSPHVVIGEAVAWGTSLLLYYVAQQPALFEEHLLTSLYAARPHPPTNAQARLRLTFSTPAPAGGRLLNAGLRFSGGGATWTLLDSYLYPEGTTGAETVLTEGVSSPAFLLPVACDQPGSKFNTAAGTITGVAQIVPGLVAVTNPDPAFGGADTETYPEMRDRYFQRRFDDNLLILPLDYERAAYRYLGVGARVHIVTPPPTPGYVHLSVLLPDGTPLVAHAGLEAHLNTRSPHAPIRLMPPALTPVPVSGTLLYDPAVITAPDLLLAAETALRTLLNPLTWAGWGSEHNAVDVSSLIAVLRNLSGVRSVTLTMPGTDLSLGQPHAVPILGEVNLSAVTDAGISI